LSGSPVPDAPGTYVLLLRPRRTGEKVRIGALGTIGLEAGRYAYVGSAFGSGGLLARVGRHLRDAKKPHWHIDHLLPAVRVEEVWLSTFPEKLEERWVEALRAAPGAEVPLRGFGAGDCGCEGHLVHLPRAPGPDLLGPQPRDHPIRTLRPGGG